jgi:hypothetical protein
MKALQKLLCRIGWHAWTWKLERGAPLFLDCNPPDHAKCSRCGIQFKASKSSDGEAIITAIVRAGAILTIEKTGEDTAVIKWHANAPEQIEAALSEAGYILTTKGKAS